MRVDIWSDLVCPWCYVGKRRFERALAEFEHREQVEVVHHSFQLDPGFPAGQSKPQVEVLSAKYGMSPAEAEAVEANMERTAAEDGLDYNLTGIRTGNTVDAHQLVHLGAREGLADKVIERLYRAHFTEQRSLFDHDSLVALAEEAGLDSREARRVLTEGTYAQAVAEDGRQAQQLGATAVPFFVIDERYGVSGAQPAELFGKALTQAWQETRG
ncbi:DsbA family oxidoreductase [Kutzneria albida]|uniref:Protein dithiol-disulfide isomerase n=1 Tax=Kutzneria albida DSM 43870 TaxID=1449976 RepID=W5W802_9PSEU|nr:DsbA family oxidoreductase [Kutzneria albida]AHH96641.1 protein dithiol-disulfide isomerase [Kutzneria albida DSM 43870]